MTRRKKILILAVLLVLALLIALLFLWRARPQPTAIVQTPPPTTQQPVEQPTPAVPTPAPVAGETPQERVATSSIQSLAKTFAERYGSFSTEAEFANLYDVLPLMTSSFAAQTQASIASAPTPPEYYGVTTRVISLTVEQMDEEAGVARMRLSTQREEAKGSPQNVSVRYQTLVLEFEFVQGAWKISSATWQ